MSEAEELRKHHPCANCKVFLKFLTSPDRALACETARAIDDCYLVKAYKEILKLIEDLDNFLHGEQGIWNVHSVLYRDSNFAIRKLEEIKKRLLSALEETNK